MKFHKAMTILTTILLVISFTSRARTLADIKVPESLKLGGQAFTLKGAAVRHTGPFGIITSYVLAVYRSDNKNSDSSHNNDKATAVWLHSFHELDKTSMRAMFINSFAKTNSKEDIRRLQDAINQFITLVGSVNDGENVAMIANPQRGVKIFKNKVSAGSVKAPNLAPMVLNIWLGPSPVSKDFKKKLLEKH